MRCGYCRRVRKKFVEVVLSVRYGSHHSHSAKAVFLRADIVKKAPADVAACYLAGAVDKNAENVMVVRNAVVAAGQYIAEWLRPWSEGVDVKANY